MNFKISVYQVEWGLQTNLVLGGMPTLPLTVEVQTRTDLIYFTPK